MSIPVLAIFEVEPIGLDGEMEANGKVYYFCSDNCRSKFVSAGLFGPYRIGDSLDTIDGTVCDWCATLV